MTTTAVPTTRCSQDDRGAAMIIAITMMALITGLGMTVFVLAQNNLKNARGDRTSTTSLANAEAGVGQAIAYLKSTTHAKLACAPTCGAANPWGEEPAEAEVARGVPDDGHPSTVVTLGTGESYKVWFQTIQQPNVTTRTPGVYTIHSIGDSTGGKRKVQVQVEVAPFNFPLAVFSDAVQAGGNGTIQTESLLSTGCITRRSKINFQGVDPIYNIPAAAHSSQYISEKDTAGSTCPQNDPDNIHKSSVCHGTATSSTVTGYPFDQDRGGGDLSGPTGANCYKKGAVRYPGSNPDYPLTSKINDATDLAKQYKFRLEGLSEEQLALLQTAAVEQGFYFTDTAAIPDAIKNATTGSITNPVLFYDLKGAAVGGTVDMKDISSYYSGGHTAGLTIDPLSASSPSCTGRSFVLIVKNGDVKMNGGTILAGSVFALGPAPHGDVQKAAGTASLIGTMYSRTLDLTGTANIGLTDCYLSNLPGQLMDITIKKFNEVDR